MCIYFINSVDKAIKSARKCALKDSKRVMRTINSRDYFETLIERYITDTKIMYRITRCIMIDVDYSYIKEYHVGISFKFCRSELREIAMEEYRHIFEENTFRLEERGYIYIRQ